MRLYIERSIEKKIKNSAKEFPVICVTGPRQTGKTTLIRKIFGNYTYITLDDLTLRSQAQRDPSLFLENMKSPWIIDEIQYAPDLLPYIKILVDKDRSRNGQCILTGSQIFPLMTNITESLAGRVALFELLGLSLEENPEPAEISLKELFGRIFIGTYPDPLVHKVDDQIFYSSYLQTYLERDIRQVSSVQDLSSFHRFLELLAARIGNLLNVNELSKECGISSTTAKRWISLLETSRIIYLLRPYFKNISKRVMKSPKVYFTDPGLAAHILRYPNSEVLYSGPQSGAFFEAFIVMEFLKMKMNYLYPYELYYFRDSNQNEIDLILDTGFEAILIEIKMANTIRRAHYSGLQKSKELFHNPKMYIVSNFKEDIFFERELKNTHWSKISSIAAHDDT
jgi:predicted AAA+ superfamily ATPase